MKPFYASVAALMLAAQMTPPIRANEEGGMKSPQKMEERHEQREAKMLEAMTKKLSLTADQQKSVKALFDHKNEKMESINKEFMEKRKSLRQETDADIEKLLSDSQKKQFTQWKTEREEHFEKRIH